jgi:hypothetical protein
MEIAIAAGIERVRVYLERQMRLLEGEEPPGVPQDAGVGDAVILVQGQWVGGSRIAPAPEQRAAGAVFKLPFRGADPPVAVGYAVPFESKHVHHPVAEESVMVLIARRVLRVRPVAIERAEETIRQGPYDREIEGVAFH